MATAANPDETMQSPLDHIAYARNWTNARPRRTVRVPGANDFAVVIAACLKAQGS